MHNRKRQRGWVVRVLDSLTTKLELFLSWPLFNSLVIRINSWLVCLPPVGIFKPIMFIWNISLFQFKWHACELARCSQAHWPLNKNIWTFWSWANTIRKVLSLVTIPKKMQIKFIFKWKIDGLSKTITKQISRA